MKSQAILVFSMLTMGFALYPHPTQTAPAKPSVETETEALEIVRTFATSELDHAMRQQRYASLDEIVASSLAKRYESQLTLKDAFSGTIGGYLLTVLPSADGKRYTLSMTYLASNCGTSFFTNEAGVIYLGKPIDCHGSELKGPATPAH